VEVVMCSVSSDRAAERIKAICTTVLLNPTIDEKRAAFVNCGPMAIFGNFYDKKISMDEGFKNFIFADIPTIGYLSTENCPFMGFRGAMYLVQSLVNEVYMGIFLETKGEMEGVISTGAVPWEIEAEQALVKIAEMIPHFVRATAVKKLHQVAEQTAQERGGKVTRTIMQEVADKFTPTKFKAKFSTVFEDASGPGAASVDGSEEDIPIEGLAFSLAWDEQAKKMLELVPPPFRKAAISNTETYARDHDQESVSLSVFEAFRKELGM
jgi:hypothetical protein